MKMMMGGTFHLNKGLVIESEVNEILKTEGDSSHSLEMSEG